jgi:hypothetical protein
MTKDEALNLALEALELTWDSGMPHPNILQVGKTITAIKQARSAPEQELSNLQRHEQNVQKFLGAQPAPVQEPVAWCRSSFIEDTDGRRIGTDDPEVVWGKKPPDPVGWEPLCYCEGVSTPEPVRECNSIDCQYIDGLGKTDCDWCRPKKSTTPPGGRQSEDCLTAAQRPVAEPHKWVGLTDEDWKELHLNTNAHTYGQAIEAKLNEKNT